MVRGADFGNHWTSVCIDYTCAYDICCYLLIIDFTNLWLIYGSGRISLVNKFWCCLLEKWWGKLQISLLQIFAILFSYTSFKQLFNNLGTESKNKIWNGPFLTKDMNFLNFHSLALSGQNASRGKISITFLFLPVPARWNPPVGTHIFCSNFANCSTLPLYAKREMLIFLPKRCL